MPIAMLLTKANVCCISHNMNHEFFAASISVCVCVCVFMCMCVFH